MSLLFSSSDWLLIPSGYSTTQDIATLAECSPNTVYKRCAREGIHPRKIPRIDHNGKKRGGTPLIIYPTKQALSACLESSYAIGGSPSRALEKKYPDHICIAQIASLTTKNKSTIYSILKRHKVPYLSIPSKPIAPSYNKPTIRLYQKDITLKLLNTHVPHTPL